MASADDQTDADFFDKLVDDDDPAPLPALPRPFSNISLADDGPGAPDPPVPGGGSPASGKDAGVHTAVNQVQWLTGKRLESQRTSAYIGRQPAAQNLGSSPVRLSEMPQDRDKLVAVRVYTVCDESKYLVVRNVPSLGCGDELINLFGTYGPIEECKPMDAEDCDPYTDVFFIKFSHVSKARFAKRKLDESVFFGNRLQVSYAPYFESLLDTKEKLELRRKEVLSRIKSSAGRPEGTLQYSVAQGSSSGNSHHQMNSNKREYVKTVHAPYVDDPRFSHVPSNKDYFPSESMNATVNLVREKLDKIQSSCDNSNVAASKKPRVDNRRRI